MYIINFDHSLKRRALDFFPKVLDLLKVHQTTNLFPNFHGFAKFCFSHLKIARESVATNLVF